MSILLKTNLYAALVSETSIELIECYRIKLVSSVRVSETFLHLSRFTMHLIGWQTLKQVISLTVNLIDFRMLISALLH